MVQTDYLFAALDSEQLKKIKKLEQELQVENSDIVLIAYKNQQEIEELGHS